MYVIQVQRTREREMSELVPAGSSDGDDAYAEVFQEVPAGLECVPFSAGNPRVEHITGVVHLFKRNDPRPGAATSPAPHPTYASKAAAAGGGSARDADKKDISARTTEVCGVCPADGQQ